MQCRNPDHAGTGRRPELPERFDVEVRPDRRRTIVIPHGELDLATVDRVAVEIDGLAGTGVEEIVLDLRRLTFMDSTGIRLILRQTRRADVSVTVIDGAEPVSRLIDVMGLRDVLPFASAG